MAERTLPHKMKSIFRGAAPAALLLLPLGLVLTACDRLDGSGGEATGEPVKAVEIPADPYPSTYEAPAAAPVLIRGATVLTGTGEEIADGFVLTEGGRILSIGPAADVPETLPEGTRVVDGAGKWVTPGLIDVHSHLGVYPSPSMPSTSDGNEAIDPNTANVWAEHSVWTQDPGFTRALAGGITTLQILPGSANLFGGRSVTLKNVSSRTVQGMKFPGAPYGLKMACGENPKRVYGGNKRPPATRMGNMAGYRAAWIDTQEYLRNWEDYRKKISAGGKEAKDAKPPKRDLKLDTLAGVLKGEIIVHMHCYRGEEMAQIIDLSKEFGYKVGTFHHAVESYKIADILAAEGICSAMWADWWGFKLEAYDMVRENIAMVDAAGACAIVHSDSDVDIQRLNQEAAKVMADGQRMGLEIDRAKAITWLTANAAKSLGIADETGTLEAGKAADIVLWNRDPFSVYALAEAVWIDGALRYDRNDPALSPRTDFEVGQLDNERTGGAGQ